jgi:hypothetical protein
LPGLDVTFYPASFDQELEWFFDLFGFVELSAERRVAVHVSQCELGEAVLVDPFEDGSGVSEDWVGAPEVVDCEGVGEPVVADCDGVGDDVWFDVSGVGFAVGEVEDAG